MCARWVPILRRATRLIVIPFSWDGVSWLRLEPGLGGGFCCAGSQVAEPGMDALGSLRAVTMTG